MSFIPSISIPSNVVSFAFKRRFSPLDKLRGGGAGCVQVVQGECSGYSSWVVMAVQWVVVRESKRGGEREGKEKNGEGNGDGVCSGGAMVTGGKERERKEWRRWSWAL